MLSRLRGPGGTFAHALREIDLLSAIGTIVRPVEFIRKDLPRFAAVVALAHKGFEVAQFLKTRAMSGYGSHDDPEAFL
jgi:hypothetical protein